MNHMANRTGKMFNETHCLLCTTEVDRTESMEERLERRKKKRFEFRGYSNHVRFSISSDRRRIRKRQRRIQVNQLTGSAVHTVFICRTEVHLLNRKECRAAKRVGKAICVKVRNLGRFRSEVEVKKVSADSGKVDSSRLEKKTAEEMELIVVHSDAKNGEKTRRKRKKRNDRNKCGQARGPCRKRRRRLVSMETFSLFKAGDVIGSAQERGDVVLSDVEKFRKSIKESVRCAHNLSTSWREVPFFRCSGGNRRNQKYVCASTMRLKKKVSDGMTCKSTVLSLIVEEQSRKVRNFILKLEKVFDGNGDITSSRRIYICSCDVEWQENGVVNSSCWHMECLRSEVEVMQDVERILESGFQDGNCMYFGDTLCISDIQGQSSLSTHGVVIENDMGTEEAMDSTDCENGMIPIQLDKLTAIDLTTKSNRIAKRWSAWNVIVTQDCLLVTVVWRPVSNGVNRTRMICVTCRTDLTRSCKHENACLKESKFVTGGTSSESGYEYEVENSSLNEDDVGHDRNDGYLEEDGVPGADGSMEVMDNNGEVTMDKEDGGREQSMHVSSSAPSVEVDNVHGPDEVSGDPDGNPPGDVNCTADNQPERNDYYPRNVRRSLILCESEKNLVENLTDLIECEKDGDGCLLFVDPEGSQCGGRFWRNGERQTCTVRRKKSNSDRPRKVTLFTLSHGTITVVLVDWFCHKCRFENRYRGCAHGIFPAKPGIAFTVDLMYWFVHEMCSNTRSFRGVYESTRKLHFSPSYHRRFGTNRVRKIPGTFKGNRRVANGAIRKFIEQMDVVSYSASKQLYSCPHCEVPMTDSDYKQLGIDPVKYSCMKRLTGVVIDAKVVHLLKDGNVVQDRHTTLNSVTGLKTKLVGNRETQIAVKMFIRTVVSELNKMTGSREAEEMEMENPDVSQTSIVRDGYVMIRLSAMKKHVTKKAEGNARKMNQYIDIIRFYIDEQCCLCKRGERRSEGDHAACTAQRKKMRGTEGRVVTCTVLSSLFELVRDPVGMVDQRPEQNDNGSEASSDEEQVSLNDAWIRFRFKNIEVCAEQVNAIMEVTRFCLTEPVSLGFFPFQTEHGVLVPEASSGAVPSEQERPERSGQGDLGVTQIGPLSTDDEVRKSVNKLAIESIALHRKVTNALRIMSTCYHVRGDPINNICNECITAVGSDFKIVALQNPIVGRYVKEVMRCGRRHVSLTKKMGLLMANLIDVRVGDMNRYLSNLSKRMHGSCIDYWKTYGSVHLEMEGGREALTDEDGRTANCSEREVNCYKNSLYIFPGRPRCHDGIVFDQLEDQDCSKNYFKGHSTIPSFLTVQCSCAHPKVLGFFILKQCESISAALSSVVTHFPIPPRRVWYDNGCNTYDSAIMRIPWYLRWTMFIVDRFHYTGHTCSNYFNGNVHRILDNDRSVAAEVINAIIDKSMSHITYLKGTNVTPFMTVLFSFLNAMAHLRDRLGRGDLEDDDTLRMMREWFLCSCHLCSGIRTDSSDNEVGQENINAHGIGIVSRHNHVTFIDDEPDNTQDDVDD